MELLLEVERFVAARRADDDVEPAPVRLLERRRELWGVAMDVNVAIDPHEIRPPPSHVHYPQGTEAGTRRSTSRRVNIVSPLSFPCADGATAERVFVMSVT